MSPDERTYAPGLLTNPESPEGEVLKTFTLENMQVKPIFYLVPERIPMGNMTIIGGEGGSGKSTLMRHLAACLTTGRPAFGIDYKPDPPCSVVIAADEDQLENVVLPSLITEGADLRRVHFVKGIKKKDSQDIAQFSPWHLPQLKALIDCNTEVRMVVIDPIVSFVGRAKVNDSKATELRQQVLDPLTRITTDTGIAMVMIAHLNKQRTDRASDKFAGSAAYKDASRVAYLAWRDASTGHSMMSHVKANVPVASSTLVAELVQASPDQLVELRRLKNFAQLDDGAFNATKKQLSALRFHKPLEDVDVDAIFCRPPAPKADTQIAKCMKWLDERLTDADPAKRCTEKEIAIEADAKGFAPKTYKTAKWRMKEHGLKVLPRGSKEGEWYIWIDRPAVESERHDETEPITAGSSIDALRH